MTLFTLDKFDRASRLFARIERDRQLARTNPYWQGIEVGDLAKAIGHRCGWEEFDAGNQKFSRPLWLSDPAGATVLVVRTIDIREGILGGRRRYFQCLRQADHRLFWVECFSIARMMT